VRKTGELVPETTPNYFLIFQGHLDLPE